MNPAKLYPCIRLRNEADFFFTTKKEWCFVSQNQPLRK